MAAVAPLQDTGSASSPRRHERRPPLRLVTPRRRRRTRAYGDALFATTLSAVLAVGIVGVLLLNTAMQTQADRIQLMRERLATLALASQGARTDLDRADSPSQLAARAAALHMRPAGRMQILRASARTPRRLPAATGGRRARLSARERAARTNRGG